MRCWLYELRKRNTPFYVGISVDPKRRENAHKRRFGRRVTLHRLVCGSVEYCQELEKKLIAKRREQYTLANRAPGGTWGGQHWVGMKHTLETRKKMSESGKRASRDPRLRKIRSEVGKRPKLKLRGRKQPAHLKKLWAEQRRAFWADSKNKLKMHRACLGRTQSEATREKIRAKAKLRWQDPNYRNIGLRAAALARAAKRG